jgi:eukaryotic-like serine/threonine-protein kinase
MPSPLSASPLDQPGRVFSDRYELVEQLGSGGMAVVWRAVQRGAHGFFREVAIKRIDPSCRGFEEVSRMFAEEARVGSLLSHPNIVQVLDFGTDEVGEPYLVSELVRGPHLGTWLLAYHERKERAPWELVTAIGIEVLRALHAAHTLKNDRGEPSPILHRDVAPENVLIDLSGVVKLADFGLARATDRRRMTRPNVVKGKLAYLAPEIFSGNGPSPQSDLFGLGVVLWEALSGRRLFHAPSEAETVARVTGSRATLLSLERPDLPLGLCKAVHRALDPEPGRRFCSARAMLEALTPPLRILPRSVDEKALSESLTP